MKGDLKIKKVFLSIIILVACVVLAPKIAISQTGNNRYIPILMYHHIVEEGEKTDKIRVTKERFKEDTEYLKKEGYTTISFKELIKYKEGKGKLPKKPIIITFDDGYKDNYEYAYPILKENNMKAAIFVIGSRIGKTNFNNDPKYNYFSWDEAKEMYNSELIEIQPHSYNLHYYKESKSHGNGVLKRKGEDKSAYYARVKKDGIQAIQIIKDKLGSESYVYAYPYGKYNRATEKILKELNIKVTLTTRNRYANISKDLYGLKRINVTSYKKLEDLLY